MDKYTRQNEAYKILLGSRNTGLRKHDIDRSCVLDSLVGQDSGDVLTSPSNSDSIEFNDGEISRQINLGIAYEAADRS